ncbi:MAG TPA: DUF2178 domain-containing protein [Steroidobacteraceae bacterium]|nr:DUF2178 domain-containing protein [Steroidobacteraceae bacterium]
MLLALGALGAAGMFLGPDGWFGIDIGPVGAAVLYGVLWLFVIHLAHHSGEVFPEHWSPAEKQSWVALVFLALITLHVGNLLLALPGLGEAAEQARNPATRALWTNLGLLIFGWIVIGTMLRRQDAGGVTLDERDLRIQHRAARVADGCMSLLIVCVVVTLFALPEQSRNWLRPMIVANALIALLIVRALVESIYTVWRYGREHGRDPA